MEWVIKANLFTVILLTQFSALFYQSEKLPYFPIEISRTASSNELSKHVFFYGMASLIISIVYSGVTEKYLPIWLSVMMLAYFDDKNHWFLHMVGVFFLFVSSFHRVYQGGFYAFYIALIALIIYLMRIVFKLFVVAYLEQGLSPWDVPSNLQSIFDQGKRIMYVGATACKRPDITLPVFRITGVMQWCTFYLLTTIF